MSDQAIQDPALQEMVSTPCSGTLGPKRVRMAVCDTTPCHSHPPLLSAEGSRARFNDATHSLTPPAQLWSQVGVATHTQTPLRDAVPSGSGPCATLHCPNAGASVVPLVPLTRPLGAWLVLPTPSYQYKVLPFRLSLSPCVFTKVMEASLVLRGKEKFTFSTTLTTGLCWPSLDNSWGQPHGMSLS